MRFGVTLPPPGLPRLLGGSAFQFLGHLAAASGDEHASVVEHGGVQSAEVIVEADSREEALGFARAAVGAALASTGHGDLELGEVTLEELD